MMDQSDSRGRQEIVVVDDGAALALEAAHRFVVIAREQIERRGRLTVALSGGSTPRALYQLLTQPPQREAIDWSRVHVFFGDERTVPPDDEQSNYRMARETLLDNVPIPHAQIHRIEAERQPGDAAARYEAVLNEVFGLAPGEKPDFGLILLGIGPDGHTASLFPGTEALGETDRLVVANVVPQLDTTRVTLTIPVITEAQHVMVLAAGADKAEAVWRAIEGPFAPDQTPSQIIRSVVGQTAWLLNAAAAGRLSAAQQ